MCLDPCMFAEGVKKLEGLIALTCFLTLGYPLFCCAPCDWLYSPCEISCSHLDASHPTPYQSAFCTCQQEASWPYIYLSLQYVFDYQEGDVFGCVADIGWITGHSYVVYGPLCNGGTTVLFESTPVYPDPGEEVVGKGLARPAVWQGKRRLRTYPVWPACSGKASSISLECVSVMFRNVYASSVEKIKIKHVAIGFALRSQ